MWGSASPALAWLMALVAAGMLEITAGSDERSPWTTAGVILTEALLVIGLHWGFRSTGWSTRTARARLTWVLALALIPWGVELGVRMGLNAMWPLELILLAAFRNAVLALAVFAHEPASQRVGCVLSTFLVIFASALAADFWLQGLVMLFAILGVWWLMGSYWETLRGRLAASSEQGLPRKWAVLLPFVVLLCLLTLPAAGTQVRALRGFMPSSGGTEQFSEAARSGVGDGDALVAGTDNIRSFAPIEDAPFLSSHEPSLYDLFDDSYNEPVKVDQQERAIAIDKEFAHQQKEHHLAQSQIAGKQFSTIRQQGETSTAKIGNRKSDAVLYVSGRVPLHLKLQVFNLYDGIEWYPQPLANREMSLKMEMLHNRPWLRLPIAAGPDIYAAAETHALKIVRLNSNHIPAPTQLLGIHLDKVNQADMFEWAQPGVVRMDREKLPSQTVIHVQSRVVDPRRCDAGILNFDGRSVIYQQFGADPDSLKVRELAQEWTRGIHGDWPQVQAIVERLRRDYVLDGDARPPKDCRNTVADFLFRSRRGPDYQFASAAVYLVRSLGHSARLVSGFYADDRNFDIRSRHTPVFAENVHFWAEVNTGSEHWIPIEPTPGYELLPPPPTLWRRLTDSAAAALAFVVRHPVACAALVLLVAVMGVLRRRLIDAVATLRWRWTGAADPRRYALQTAALLDRRFQRAGLARPVGHTHKRWLRALAQSAAGNDDALLEELTALFDWAGFAPAAVACPADDPISVCRNAERTWNWQRLTQIAELKRQSQRPRPKDRNRRSISLPILQPAQGTG